MIKIIGSYTSPYVRIVRAFCHEFGIEFELEETPPFASMTPDIALVCMMEWFARRGVVDWAGYAGLVRRYEQIKDRACFVQTRIPDGA